MGLSFNFEAARESASSIDAWVWPLIAAAIVSGTLVFWSLAAMFWLASHPLQQSTIVVVQPTENNTTVRPSVDRPAEAVDEEVRDVTSN
jgi:hypothetical protein